MIRPERDVLFGEWCYAKHSLHYTSLPDVFLAFDLFDAEKGKFLSRKRFLKRLEATTLKIVPKIVCQAFASTSELLALLDTKSEFRDGFVEGIYLRLDQQRKDVEQPDGVKFGPFLERRAKLVRPDFIQSIEDHWSKGQLVKNVVIYS